MSAALLADVLDDVMSWTRLDDLWCEQTAFDDVPHEARWHYFAMAQFCRSSGRTRRVSDRWAERCSDVPDSAGAVATLVRAGLLSASDGFVFPVSLDRKRGQKLRIGYPWGTRPPLYTARPTDRWHLFELISLCSRECLVDGVVARDLAASRTTVPAMDDVHARLIDSGALAPAEGGVRVSNVGTYLTSKLTAAEKAAAIERRRVTSADRKRRKRAEVNDVVFARDNYCCVACGATDDLTVDHKHPQFLGGDNGGEDYPNLQTLCRRCNASKGVRLDWPGRPLRADAYDD